jgi:predicted GNAT superfamily acetyltransferase
VSIADPHTLEATTAAQTAGVVVRAPASQRELRQLSAVLAEIWQVPAERSPGPVNILTALRDTGGYLAGAWRGEELIGGSFGLTYVDDGVLCLRSQVTGSLVRDRGVGLALKLHQRAWAVAAGVDRITWTFDPLVRRNARFNLHRLGARIVRYVPDFYGSLDDGMSGTFPTDRCVVVWGATGPLGGVSTSDPAVVALDHDGRGGPRVSRRRIDGAPRTLAIPHDVVALRATAPDQAARWASAMQRVMTTALTDGLVGVDVTGDGRYRFESAAPTAHGGCA